MKRIELRPCSLCGQPLTTDFGGGTSGFMAGMRVTVQRMFIDSSALKESIGLTMMLGSAELADVMGTDRDVLAEPKELRTEFLLCNNCSMPVMEMTERAEENKKQEPAK